MDRLCWLHSGPDQKVDAWPSPKGRVHVFLAFHSELFDQYQVRRGVRLVVRRLLCGVRAMRELVCGFLFWRLCGRRPKQRHRRCVL